MRTFLRFFLLLPLPLLLALPLEAQEVDPQKAPALAVLPQPTTVDPSVPHPALLALQEWNALQLTPKQVGQLREVQDEASSLLMAMFAEQIRDTVLVSAWLFEQEVDEAAVRASVLRQAEQEAELLIALLTRTTMHSGPAGGKAFEAYVE